MYYFKYNKISNKYNKLRYIFKVNYNKQIYEKKTSKIAIYLSYGRYRLNF